MPARKKIDLDYMTDTTTFLEVLEQEDRAGLKPFDVTVLKPEIGSGIQPIRTSISRTFHIPLPHYR
jgi:hypothetical protein